MAVTKDNQIDEEIWKPITGYEGLYEVSNMGRVKSVDRVLQHKSHGVWHIKERILKQQWTGSPNSSYLSVWLHKGHGEQHLYRVHRIVAETFIPNPEGKEQVNHINCDRSDNRISNLEWTTPLENTQHAWEHGRCDIICKQHRKAVVNVDTGERFNCLKDAADMYGVTLGAIANAAKGKSAKSAGFIWQYADEYDKGLPLKHPRNMNFTPVIQLDISGQNEIARYDSAKEAERKTGTNRQSIRACCRGRYHTAGGYKWRYAYGKGKASKTTK